MKEKQKKSCFQLWNGGWKGKRRNTACCQVQHLLCQNMLLKATQLGLGTLWIANTCFAYNDMVEVIPSKGQLIGAVAVGYAAEKPYPRPRKKLEEILEYM